MLQFVPPDIAESPLVFVPEDGFRGSDDRGPSSRPAGRPLAPPHSSESAPVTGQVFLGGPVSVPVTPDYVAEDPDLRAFVEREAEHSVYHLVHLSVSFRSGPGLPRLHTSSVELRLSSPSKVRAPVAWSMSPLRVSDVSQTERTFSLGPELKFQDVEMTVGGYEASTSRTRAVPFLLGVRELREDPGWEFTRTRTMSLDGSHRLVLVVRSDRNAPTGVTGTVRASTRGNLLRRYKSALPEPLTLNAVL